MKWGDPTKIKEVKPKNPGMCWESRITAIKSYFLKMELEAWILFWTWIWIPRIPLMVQKSSCKAIEVVYALRFSSWFYQHPRWLQHAGYLKPINTMINAATRWNLAPSSMLIWIFQHHCWMDDVWGVHTPGSNKKRLQMEDLCLVNYWCHIKSSTAE